MATLLQTLLFLIIAYLVLTPLHGLVQALAARLLGYRVREIAIGFGAPMGGWRMGGTIVRLRRVALPGMPGQIRLAPTHAGRFPRLRHCLAVGAGPALHVAIFFIFRDLFRMS